MKAILSAVWHLFLSLDGIIYNLICYIFDIFYYLCGLQLFTDADYNEIVNKIYMILGLVMMFVLAYSLLKAVINPDEFAKGENSFPKLIKNVIVSLVIIVILPTVFNVAFSIQNSLLNYDVIPQLIFILSNHFWFLILLMMFAMELMKKDVVTILKEMKDGEKMVML